MKRKSEISGLQIMCQYQITALLSGAQPAIVFSQPYIDECRRRYAQSSPRSTKPVREFAYSKGIETELSAQTPQKCKESEAEHLDRYARKRLGRNNPLSPDSPVTRGHCFRPL